MAHSGRREWFSQNAGLLHSERQGCAHLHRKDHFQSRAASSSRFQVHLIGATVDIAQAHAGTKTQLPESIPGL